MTRPFTVIDSTDRVIRIPADALARVAICRCRDLEKIQGRAMLFPVQVDWPELRLTEEQILANALWATLPHRTTPRPFPDRSIFDIELPYVDLRVKR